ncbi:MAG: hypothetical protein ACPG4T_24900, partial [Nannocystaceae bacterium]
MLIGAAILAWGGVGLVRFSRNAAPSAAPPTAALTTPPVEQAAKPSPPREAAAEDPARAVEPEPAPEPEPEPEPEPGGSINLAEPSHDRSWAGKIDPPQQVKYTIRFGGSLRRVANLFKIFHHEIQELNPGVDIDRELPPNTKVVVYRAKDGLKGESIDFPGSG